MKKMRNDSLVIRCLFLMVKWDVECLYYLPNELWGLMLPCIVPIYVCYMSHVKEITMMALKLC